MISPSSHEAPQRSEEWHKARGGRITASVVGAIMGYSPFKTREKLMLEMIEEYQTGERPSFDNPATAWGNANEEGAVREFEMLTGLDVEPAPFIPFEDWGGASPDGYVSDGSIIEIKCPFGIRKDEKPEFKTAKEQMHYYAQMQMQMLATGAKKCHFFQWAVNGNSYEVVKRDEKFIKKMLKECKAFWDEYLERRDHAQGFTSDLMDEYQATIAQIKELEEKKKQLLQGLVELTDGKGGEINGHKLYKVVKDGAISYAKAIKELLPDADLEPYRGKPAEYWVVK